MKLQNESTIGYTKRADDVRYSVIVPLYNERENIKELHEEIVRVMGRLDGAYEIIYVDDGSTDGTAEELYGLQDAVAITHRRNCGQSLALQTGISSANGDLIITLDGDGQNDPADIPALLKHLSLGYDVVCGWRKKRNDPFGKRIASRGAYAIRRVLLADGVHDSGCTLRVYTRSAAKALDLYGELHRFIPAILRWEGFRVTEMTVNHRPRRKGKTKYRSTRLLHGLLDVCSLWFWQSYGLRPMQLFGRAGIFAITIGGGGILVLAVLRAAGRISLTGRIWPLAFFFTIVMGIQLFTTGLLADLFIKTAREKRLRDQ